MHKLPIYKYPYSIQVPDLGLLHRSNKLHSTFSFAHYSHK